MNKFINGMFEWFLYGVSWFLIFIIFKVVVELIKIWK
jgi:hypothetical protein